MNIKCLFRHQWNGCKCERCGKIRDEGHDWDLCAGKCKKCGTSCGVKHDFQPVAGKCGKVCSVCGKEDSYSVKHDFQPVAGRCVKVCSVCGQEDYKKYHTYQPVSGECVEACSVCGNTQKIGHIYNNGKCTRCGVDINARAHGGVPPLIWAALEGNVEEVKSLLKGGAKVNIFTDETPLMAAARKGYDSNHIEIVELLLAHGADVNATDIYGSSALRLAHRKGLSKMVDLLAAHGGKYLGA